jgi:hypothetical protein
MMPVSNDTLLRVVIRPVVRVSNRHWSSIGERPWRRDQRYGTIICDLEPRKTIVGHRRWRNGQMVYDSHTDREIEPGDWGFRRRIHHSAFHLSKNGKSVSLSPRARP